jgi:hypothetical protein
MHSRTRSWHLAGAVLIWLLCACGPTPTQVPATEIPAEVMPTASVTQPPTVPPEPTDEPEARVNPADLPQGQWVELEPMPLAVSEITGALLDGVFYVAGGYTAEGSIGQALQAYSVADDTWTLLAGLPEGRTHVATAAYQGRVYVFGGEPRYASGPRVRRAWLYDPITDSWESIARMPAGRMATASVTVGEAIYIVGGLTTALTATGPGTRNEALRYTPATDEWTVLSRAAETREHAGAALVRGRLHLIGGRSGGVKSSVEIYDVESDTWSEGTPMLEPRSAFATIVLGGEIWVCGGEAFEPEARVIDTVEIYDPTTDSWTPGPPLPVGIHGLAGFTYNDAIYLIGGSDVAGAVENYGRVLAYRP